MKPITMTTETTISATHDIGLPAHSHIVNFRGAALVEDGPPSASSERTPGITDVSGTDRDCIHDNESARISENARLNENARMQICWDGEMRKELKVPEGYQNTAVLIIKWMDDIDQLKSSDEVCLAMQMIIW